MICQLCGRNVKKVLKLVKKTEIFECVDCKLAFISQDKTKKINSRKLTKLYDFKEYKKQEKKLRKWFGRLTNEIFRYKKSGKVLDVGAGFGLFSSVLKTKGDYRFDLVEPNSKIRFIDKSYFLHKTSFEKFKSKNKYDVIVMMDVIEHFQNPIANLSKARYLLHKDGILVIQTPNYRSLMARICKNWAWWMIEDHKFFLSLNSLQKMLRKTGFNTEYLMTYEDWYDFKKNLDGNFIALKINSLRKIIKGLFFGFFFPTYFLFRSLIWKMNYGGLIFVIAKKA